VNRVKPNISNPIDGMHFFLQQPSQVIKHVLNPGRISWQPLKNIADMKAQSLGSKGKSLNNLTKWKMGFQSLLKINCNFRSPGKKLEANKMTISKA
jgi:hypothetical protein